MSVKEIQNDSKLTAFEEYLGFFKEADIFEAHLYENWIKKAFIIGANLMSKKVLKVENYKRGLLFSFIHKPNIPLYV